LFLLPKVKIVMSTKIEEGTFGGPGPEARFRAGLAEGKFVIQQCGGCGKHVFYPRVLCPYCGSADLRGQEASGRGTVYSVTIVRQKPEAGGDYNIALVDIAEGPRMMSQVVGIPAGEVKIGMALKAKISEIDGQPAVVFEKA